MVWTLVWAKRVPRWEGLELGFNCEQKFSGDGARAPNQLGVEPKCCLLLLRLRAQGRSREEQGRGFGAARGGSAAPVRLPAGFIFLV